MQRQAWKVLLLLLVQHPCPGRAVQPDIYSLTSLSEPSNEVAEVSEKTLHCEVRCCGFGHRMAVVMEAYHTARALNKTLAISWGPCKEATKNVFAALFPRAGGGDVIGASNQAITWNPRSEAHNDCRKIVGRDQRTVKYNVAALDLFQQLGHQLAPMVQRQVDAFKSSFEGFPIIGLHVRTGNLAPNDTVTDRDFNLKGRSIDMPIKLFLRRHLHQIHRLAVHMGYGERYKVFLSTDSLTMQKEFMAEAGPHRGVVRSQPFPGAGHHMMLSQLGSNNKGSACDIKWFLNPLVDNLLLASTRMLVIAKPSTFPRMAEHMLYAQRKLVCESWPAHAGVRNQSATSHDYRCYKYLGNGRYDAKKLTFQEKLWKEHESQLLKRASHIVQSLHPESESAGSYIPPPVTRTRAEQPLQDLELITGDVAYESTRMPQAAARRSNQPLDGGAVASQSRCPKVYTPTGIWTLNGAVLTYTSAAGDSLLEGLTCTGVEALSNGSSATDGRRPRCSPTGRVNPTPRQRSGVVGFRARTVRRHGTVRRIYLRGDSTCRQIFQDISETLTGGVLSNDDFKLLLQKLYYQERNHGGGVHETRASSLICKPQTHRSAYRPGGNFGIANCQLNELTCQYEWQSPRSFPQTPQLTALTLPTIELPSTALLQQRLRMEQQASSAGPPRKPGLAVTWDWMHFVLEDRERYIFAPGSSFEFEGGAKGGADPSQGAGEGRYEPDYLVVRLPMHLCSHTTPPTGKLNRTQTQVWLDQLPQLMESMRARFSGPIIWIDAAHYRWGGRAENQRQQFHCIENINARMRSEAVSKGMYVLNTEIMEKRYTEVTGDFSMHKGHVYMHTLTSHLFHLMNCIDDSTAYVSYDV